MKLQLLLAYFLTLGMTHIQTIFGEAIEENAVPGYAVLPVFDEDTPNWDKLQKSGSIAVINNVGGKKPLITRGGDVMRDAVTVSFSNNR
jgi:hypothetical protein